MTIVSFSHYCRVENHLEPKVYMAIFSPNFLLDLQYPNLLDSLQDLWSTTSKNLIFEHLIELQIVYIVQPLENLHHLMKMVLACTYMYICISNPCIGKWHFKDMYFSNYRILNSCWHSTSIISVCVGAYGPILWGLRGTLTHKQRLHKFI